MLSREQNERLTRVGPGTPCGNLLRHYWHPVAPAIDLDENPVRKVRLLGEDLVLYRDRSGTLGLVEQRCPHRRVSMEYAIPEDEGLRCSYHGWRFDHDGRCLEQPGEPWNSSMKNHVRIKAYPVQELAGLVFAYLGPQPAPLLPRYDLLVWEDSVRHLGITTLPCNWLQCVENTMDPVHVEWLHGHTMDYAWERQGRPLGYRNRARHARIGFDLFEHGIVKRRIMEGETEEDETWTIGHPFVFPYIARNQHSFQWRVPIDDTHTYHVFMQVYRTGLPVAPQKRVPAYEIPLHDEQGRVMTEVLQVQDYFAWTGQGEISDRENEHLGQEDAGVVMFRRMLGEQIERVEHGAEPSIGIHRDPAKNHCIDLAEEVHPYNGMDRMRESERIQQGWAFERFHPGLAELVEYLKESERRLDAGEIATPPSRASAVPVGGAHEHLRIDILPPELMRHGKRK